MVTIRLRSLNRKSISRLNLVWLLTVLMWLKMFLAYLMDFSLGVKGFYQWLILLSNPVAGTLLIMSLSLYIKRPMIFKITALLLDAANTLLLYVNVIYFREFSDFVTLNTVLGYSKISNGLGMSSLALTEPHDLFYWLDLVILGGVLLTNLVKVSPDPVPMKAAFAVSSLAVCLVGLNLTMSELDRPQLLSRTFDRKYLVKYLGIDGFSTDNLFQTAHTSEIRAKANRSRLSGIKEFVDRHQAKANPAYFGLAKGKNVIVIHLESFQQFLIGDKVEGQTVTPFLNRLFHSRQTISYDNFFHQVGEGKTSDAENMLEDGTFGLPEGSLFTQLGDTQTFQSAPAILGQNQHYTSAVFHGDVPSFWNRNNVYKNMGYQYFFSANDFDTAGDRSIGYGLKDKLLFKDSIKYLQHLQQPFYVKYITLTNHFPFDLDSQDTNFKTPNTGDAVVNNYFKTAHYLDQSVHEFFRFLKKSGLSSNTMVVLYGDHYGLSNQENLALSKTFSQDPKHFKKLFGKHGWQHWSNWDNAQLQRVPLMIHLPKYHRGHVSHQYGGEIDVLPTILHLLGIKTTSYMQFGTDLLSPAHSQVVSFRNRDFVTPTFSQIGNVIYDQSGTPITPQGKQLTRVKRARRLAHQRLDNSDVLNSENLLRFNHPNGFKAVNPAHYHYTNQLKQELRLEKRSGHRSTSLASKWHRSLIALYHTDAPEAGRADQ
ncbi:LTA synthase family protein [Lentilactobacillus raoultii]|uniref:LTA synthase family protein n=1 Tax=Lentilactobacillus raoultii TaxID=1987503 RepID=A0ABW3PSM6_9LACO|nr:LTA synthase family protein [Lentilactobacillus raoultii]